MTDCARRTVKRYRLRSSHLRTGHHSQARRRQDVPARRCVGASAPNVQEPKNADNEGCPWNINGIGKRINLLSRWLAESSPDVVALQERKSTDAAFPRHVLEDAGYGAIFVGERSWNGVAILANGKQPVEARRSLPGGTNGLQARYIEAAVDGVLYSSIYLPNGNPQPGAKFAYKLAWFERLIVHARTLMDTGLPVALLRDFNVVPTELDIYRTTSYRNNALVQPASREAYRRLVNQGW